VRRFLLLTPPFSGHANVLTRNVVPLADASLLVVTGWENVPYEGSPHVRFDAPPLHQTDPSLWTLPRVAALLPRCLMLARSYRPDVILYDFFSLEGYLVGKVLGIPAWCSVPAFVGASNPYFLREKLSHPTNIAALAEIEAVSGIRLDPNDFETVSDGLHLRADLHLIWSWPSVTDTHLGAWSRAFVGSSIESAPGAVKLESASGAVKLESASGAEVVERPLVLLSFGTVVMGNLWRQQPVFRYRFQAFIQELAERWKDSDFDVHFVTQGQEVLPSYPSNWTVSDRVDQGEVLRKASVFVTHGGSNSVHESIVREVPMVVVPFFGDQPDMAHRVSAMGIGINVGRSVGMDTKDASRVLHLDLAERVDQATRELLENPGRTRNILSRLRRDATPLRPLLEGRIPFEEGNILYGPGLSRAAYVDAIGGQKDFRMFEFRPFSEIAPSRSALPRIVDIYHDAVRDEAALRREIACGMEPYATWIREYAEFLGGERNVAEMCMRGLDFFAQRARIRFLLDGWDPALNRITTQEIRYILANRARFEARVTFYRQLAQTWVPVGFDEVTP